MRGLYSISQAAKILGKSMMTLRRWEQSGRLVPQRSKGGHRYYTEEDLENCFKDLDIFKLAERWIKDDVPQKPVDFFYCRTQEIFRERLAKLENKLIKTPAVKEKFSLISAIVGEIGNNSFDHNLGNWPDIMGIFFGYDLKNRQVVLADRGQGVLTTLKKQKPELKDDQEALQTAFTEVISGRAPEHRGNGLKYVRAVVVENDLHLIFQSGQARLDLKKGDQELSIKKMDEKLSGCLVLIKF